MSLFTLQPGNDARIIMVQIKYNDDPQNRLGTSLAKNSWGTTYDPWGPYMMVHICVEKLVWAALREGVQMFQRRSKFSSEISSRGVRISQKISSGRQGQGTTTDHQINPAGRTTETTGKHSH